MTATRGPIASAVVLPDTVSGCTKSPSTKRRQSSEPEERSKRPRISEEPINTSPNVKSEDAPSNAPSKDKPIHLGLDRRKSSVQEERKRGQRLFGGLLSTLSQSTPNGQQKRRQEIEKRQQEKAKQQKAEDEKRQARKREDTVAVQKAEQIKFEEASMRTRHRNMLAMAHSLCTKSEPKLYYKPWGLLPQDEERIKFQIAEAEDQVRGEDDEFFRRYPEHSRKKSSVIKKTNVRSSETVGEPQHESPPVSNVADDITNDTAAQAIQEQDTSEKQSLEEQNGEVVVENEEDTVIY